MTILHDAVHTARKPRTCDQCLRLIQVGQRYRKQVHTYEEFTVYCAHEDCDQAASRMHDLGNLLEDEAVLLHSHVVPEDHEMLLAEFPAVAERMGISGLKVI